MSNSDGYPQITMDGTDPNLPDDFSNSYTKYTRFQKMARGGKAQLYSAWDSVLGRPVAVKTLRAELANNDYERRRFLREVRVTAQLQHPNTVPVYEVGRASDGSLYFTMKRLLGEDLYSVVVGLQKKDPAAIAAYPLERLLNIVIQACQALAYAHSHGVIHRDVKPENIWVGRFTEVLVLDWGVAKVWGQPDEPDPTAGNDEAAIRAAVALKDADSSDEDSKDAPSNEEEKEVEDAPRPDPATPEGRMQTLTRSGVRPGTPLYMSPEQVDGQKYVDERTDIFSIGVVLYELLTLHLPFCGANVNATFKKIVNDNPKRPRHRAPFRDIPEDVEAIVLKALQKDPTDRHQSMQQLIDEIRAARRAILFG